MHYEKPSAPQWKLLIVMILVSGCAAPPSTEPVADSAPAASPPPRSTESKAPEGQSQAAAPQREDAANDEPQLAPSSDPPPRQIVESTAPGNGSPQRTAFYRVDAGPAEIPSVVLSKGHQELCRVKVGDKMPDIALPQIGSSDPAKLADLFGEKATVVVFWSGDRRMAREQLADLGPDVIAPFGNDGVAVVGIAVEKSSQDAQSALQQVRADFPNLLDAGGEAFAKVGSEKLPRTYLLDPQGKILWFDIEYSLGTRRELHQALRAVVAGK